MFLKYKFISLLVILKVSEGNMTEKDSSIEKKYMVYFVHSPITKNFQDSWVCGGALVTPSQILTAAACLVETEHIYAIAGYKKYIDAINVEHDECTRTRKQRVVKILVPIEPLENPAERINIGVAIVEKPYDFNDLTYVTHCSYEPQPINVNFDSKYDMVNTRAGALGWEIRVNKPEFTQETKNQLLHETSTLIVDNKICSNIFATHETMGFIDKYHLCGTYFLQEVEKDTHPESHSERIKVQDSKNKQSKSNNDRLEDSFEFKERNTDDKNKTRRKDFSETNYSQEELSDIDKYSPTIEIYGKNARRTMDLHICQNNLGSPLIKRIEDKEIVIGIATSNNRNNSCNEPILYVSTAASTNLVKCLLELDISIRQLCKISYKDFLIQEFDINWPKPVDSEVLEPMLDIERAVLDKLDTLMLNSTTLCHMNHDDDIINSKENDQKKENTHLNKKEFEYDQVNVRIPTTTYLPLRHIYIQKRANEEPLIAQSQYGLKLIDETKRSKIFTDTPKQPSQHLSKTLKPEFKLQSDLKYQAHLSSDKSTRLQPYKTQEQYQNYALHKPKQRYVYLNRKYDPSPEQLGEYLQLREQYEIPLNQNDSPILQNFDEPIRQSLREVVHEQEYTSEPMQKLFPVPSQPHKLAQFELPEGSILERQSPEVLYDQPSERHRRPSADSNQPIADLSQVSSSKGPFEFMYPTRTAYNQYIDQGEPVSSTTDLPENVNISFEQIQEPGSDSQSHGNDSAFNNIFEKVLQGKNKHADFYEETSKQSHRKFKLDPGPPLRSDDFVLRPQIPIRKMIKI